MFKILYIDQRVATCREIRRGRFLRRGAEYAGAPLPELVLLDLDLSRKDGREVLTEVKGDPRAGARE